METLEVRITPGDLIDIVHLGRVKNFCNRGAAQARLLKRGWRMSRRTVIDGLKAEVWRPMKGSVIENENVQ